MKLLSSTTTLLILLAACGGPSKPKAAAPTPAPMVETKPVVEEPPAPPEPPPPPPPMEWHASAQLAPVKGSKMPAVDVVFFQVEGEAGRARSSGAFEKLKAGKYHLVVHQGSECGAKASKAGGTLFDLSAEQLLVATRKEAPSFDVQSATIALDGEGSIVGHALVLPADKRGKLGAAVACGVIVGDAAAAATDE